MIVQQALLPTDRPVPIRVAGGSESQGKLSDLLHDFYASARSGGSWFYSSWIDILLNYRSTFLGPIWILVGTGIFVFAVGNLYGRVVIGSGGTNIYLAHLAIGITVWYFITQSIVGSCTVFSTNKSNILDGADTYPDLILKLVMTNLIYLLHNSVIIVLVFVVVELKLSSAALVLLLTLPLVLANILWMCVIVAILGARYGDLEELLHSVLRLLFFVTPILWVPHKDVRGPIIDLLLYLNPFYYLVEVIRVPLVYGQVPALEISVMLAALPLGWLAASLLYARTRWSIALWL